jgi:predicted DNA-binding transcriptional regulator YafY
MSPVDVVHIIRSFLEAQPRTREEIMSHVLSEGYSISDRTLFRHLDRIKRQVGADWQEGTSTIGRQKWYRVKRSHSRSHEALAPFIVHRAIRQLAAIDERDEVKQAIELLSAAQPLKKDNVMLSEHDMPYIEIGDYRGGGIDIDVLQSLVDAIQHRQIIRFSYRSNRRGEKLPLRILEYKGLLYVIVWSVQHKRYEPYRIDGITDVLPSQTTAPHKTFDFEEFMSTRFGLWEGNPPETKTVVVEIQDPLTASNFRERRWHPSQQVADLPDGGVRITMHCGMSPELTSWILHWAPKIQVVEPEELRSAVSELAKTMVQS